MIISFAVSDVLPAFILVLALTIVVGQMRLILSYTNTVLDNLPPQLQPSFWMMVLGLFYMVGPLIATWSYQLYGYHIPAGPLDFLIVTSMLGFYVFVVAIIIFALRITMLKPSTGQWGRSSPPMGIAKRIG